MELNSAMHVRFLSYTHGIVSTFEDPELGECAMFSPILDQNCKNACSYCINIGRCWGSEKRLQICPDSAVIRGIRILNTSNAETIQLFEKADIGVLDEAQRMYTELISPGLDKRFLLTVCTKSPTEKLLNILDDRTLALITLSNFLNNPLLEKAMPYQERMEMIRLFIRCLVPVSLRMTITSGDELDACRRAYDDLREAGLFKAPHIGFLRYDIRFGDNLPKLRQMVGASMSEKQLSDIKFEPQYGLTLSRETRMRAYELFSDTSVIFDRIPTCDQSYTKNHTEHLDKQLCRVCPTIRCGVNGSLCKDGHPTGCSGWNEEDGLCPNLRQKAATKDLVHYLHFYKNLTNNDLKYNLKHCASAIDVIEDILRERGVKCES